MNLFRKKSHITLRSCLLALRFDPTTLIEIAVYRFAKITAVCTLTRLRSGVERGSVSLAHAHAHNEKKETLTVENENNWMSIVISS